MLFELRGFIHKCLLANHLYEAEAVEFVTACKNNSLFVTKSAFEHNDMMIFSIFLLPLKKAISRIPKKQTLTSFLFNLILPLFNTWWVSNRSVSDGSSRIWKIWKRKRSERGKDLYEEGIWMRKRPERGLDCLNLSIAQLHWKRKFLFLMLKGVDSPLHLWLCKW